MAKEAAASPPDGGLLTVRVQSHPSRRELRERLLKGLHGLPVETVETDFEPPNPWLGYLACIESAPSDGHVLIVQDDTIACRNVTPALRAIVEVVPDSPVCVFLGLLPMRTRKAALEAGKRGERFVDIHHGDFMPVVATLWPVDKAREFAEWATTHQRVTHRRNGTPFVERSDDAMAGRWMRSTRQRVLATIPSLFEHPDDVPSTIARKPSGRTALFWHGPDWDASEVSWTL
jgi:hypothetical protein